MFKLLVAFCYFLPLPVTSRYSRDFSPLIRASCWFLFLLVASCCILIFLDSSCFFVLPPAPSCCPLLPLAPPCYFLLPLAGSSYLLLPLVSSWYPCISSPPVTLLQSISFFSTKIVSCPDVSCHPTWKLCARSTATQTLHCAVCVVFHVLGLSAIVVALNFDCCLD